MAYDLNPETIMAYSNQRRQAMSNWANQDAQINYNRNNAAQQYGLDQNHAAYQWNQRRTGIPGQSIRRGTFNSGIYQNQLGNYGTEREHAFNQLAHSYQTLRDNYAMQATQNNQNYWNTMQNIDDQQRMNRANIAAQLQGIA